RTLMSRLRRFLSPPRQRRGSPHLSVFICVHLRPKLFDFRLRISRLRLIEPAMPPQHGIVLIHIPVPLALIEFVAFLPGHIPSLSRSSTPAPAQAPDRHAPRFPPPPAARVRWRSPASAHPIARAPAAPLPSVFQSTASWFRAAPATPPSDRVSARNLRTPARLP